MVPGQIGLIQATEVLKLVLGIGKPMIGKFLVYGALDANFHLITVERNLSCPLCGDKPSIKGLMDNAVSL